MSTLHSLGDIIAERYRITAVLGNPNKSNTYVAEDFIRNKLVAIKAISLRQMHDWKDLELLERQANVLASLDHPAVPKYIEYFHLDTDRDRSFYLVQQLIQGDSLADLVTQGWRANEGVARQLALQVLETLRYLHQHTPPVIHRDIQPCNLLQGADSYIFLVDFGSVKATNSSQQYSSTFVGTYGYIPPEQFYGKAHFASDLYSLGASLLFVLTGKTPDEFLHGSTKINFRSNIQLSPHFTNWLEKMLEPSPKARFHSASEAIAALQRQKTSFFRLKPTAPPSVVASPISEPKENRSIRKLDRKQQPAGSQVILRRTEGRFVVEIPPGGSVNRKGNLFGVFSWWHRLEIYAQWFEISKGHLGFQTSHEGKTSDIIKAELRVESVFWGETNYALLLWEGVTAHNFAPALTSVEKEWLVDEIADFLDYLQVLQKLEKLVDES